MTRKLSLTRKLFLKNNLDFKKNMLYTQFVSLTVLERQWITTSLSVELLLIYKNHLIAQIILLHKLPLWNKRLSQDLVILLQYLSNRKQFVTINDFNSETQSHRYRVPQGSVLCPLLFLTYINDLHNAIRFFQPLHSADDTRLKHSKQNF